MKESSFNKQAPGRLLEQGSLKIWNLEQELAAKVLGQAKMAEIALFEAASNAVLHSMSDEEKDDLKFLDNVHGGMEWEMPNQEFLQTRVRVRKAATNQLTAIPGLELMRPSICNGWGISFLGTLAIEGEVLTDHKLYFEVGSDEAHPPRTQVVVRWGPSYDFARETNRMLKIIFKKASEPKEGFDPEAGSIQEQLIQDSPFDVDSLLSFVAGWQHDYKSMLNIPLDTLITRINKAHEVPSEDID